MNENSGKVQAWHMDDVYHHQNSTNGTMRMQELLNWSPVVTYIRQVGSGVFTFISDNVFTHLGYNTCFFQDNPEQWAHCIHHEDVSDFHAVFSDLDNRDECAIEYRFLHADGTYRYVYDHFKIVRDAYGTAVELIGYVEDRTTRQAAEDELQVFKELAEHSSDGIAIGTPDSLILYSNPAYNRMMGIENAVGCMGVDFVADEDHEYLTNVVMQTIAHGSWEGKLTYRCADGHMFPAQVSIFFTYDAQSNPHTRTVVIRDISDSVCQERRLQTFETLVAHAPYGIGVSDAEGNLTYVNAAFKAFFGYEDTLYLGKAFVSFLADDERHHVPEIAHTIMEHGTWQGRLTFQRADGDMFPCLASAFLIFDDQGQVYATTAIIQDISDWQRLEQERLDHKEHVIAAQQHALRELSTPLIPLADKVVAMPLIGSIDTTRAQQVMDSLLEGVAAYQAEVAILDITGVSVVDTQVANAIVQAARAVGLLGAQVVLTGIGPAMAQTLVHLGADMSEIITRSTLQAGIAYAMQSR